MLIKKEEKMMSKRKKKGFTLIELIVVIAILGILAAIMIPKFSGFQGNANKKATLATLRSIDTAIAVVASENNVDTSAMTGASDADPVTAGVQSLDSLVWAQLGLTAYPTTSPKGVTYSITAGAGHAAVTAGTAWFETINAAGYNADALK